LLDILSNGNNPVSVNRHMSRIFQAVESLTMQPTSDEGERPIATHLISCVGGEVVVLVEPLPLLNNVELYLRDLLWSMKDTLRRIAGALLSEDSADRKAVIGRYPSQVQLLINNVRWSNDVQAAFLRVQEGDLFALNNYHSLLVERLTQLINYTQEALEPAMRQKIVCQITMDTHMRDVVERLIEARVRHSEEFLWNVQLKFYWLAEERSVAIKITDACLSYDFEYLGNGPRLVITPLTDRIYVTATQAFHLKMGCAPAGPAGTGKTETSKDLSNAVGKACYVFNCSSEMNYESMGSIFKGLASSGCSGCFDEFNRLLPEVLSVCSVQFKAVTDAIRRKAAKFVIEGDEISLD